MSTHIKILREGKCLVIFPEGKITRDGSIQPARGGVSFLSYETGTAVVPVAIMGTYEYSWRKFFSRKHPLSVIFGKPILPEELFPMHNNSVQSAEEHKVIAEKIMSKIKTLLL